MSAWGIGTISATRRMTGAGDDPEAKRTSAAEPRAASIDTLITWIPGEVIAAYAAVVLALQPEQGEGADPPPVEVTAFGWLLAGILFAAALTFLSGWSKGDRFQPGQVKELGTRVILSAIAFAIWSFVVPASWWYSIDQIAENQTVIPVVAGLVGAAFGLFAEGLVRRMSPSS